MVTSNLPSVFAPTPTPGPATGDSNPSASPTNTNNNVNAHHHRASSASSSTHRSSFGAAMASAQAAASGNNSLVDFRTEARGPERHHNASDAVARDPIAGALAGRYQPAGAEKSGQGSAGQGSSAACDACRTRKVKCTPVDVEDQEKASAVGAKCKLCLRRGDACSYDYVYKKPGRPAGSTKRRRTSHSPSPADEEAGPSSGKGTARNRSSPSPDRHRRESESQHSVNHPPVPHFSQRRGHGQSFSSDRPSPRNQSQSPYDIYRTYSQSAQGTGPETQDSVAHMLNPLDPSGSTFRHSPVHPLQGQAPGNVIQGGQGMMGMGNARDMNGPLDGPGDPNMALHAGMFNTGPASGTIFGSALSALHSDHTFTDLFAPSFGMGGTGGMGGFGGAPMNAPQMQQGQNINGPSNGRFNTGDGPMPGISIDLGPSPNWTNWQQTGATPSSSGSLTGALNGLAEMGQGMALAFDPNVESGTGAVTGTGSGGDGRTQAQIQAQRDAEAMASLAAPTPGQNWSLANSATFSNPSTAGVVFNYSSTPGPGVRNERTDVGGNERSGIGRNQAQQGPMGDSTAGPSLSNRNSLPNTHEPTSHNPSLSNRNNDPTGGVAPQGSNAEPSTSHSRRGTGSGIGTGTGSGTGPHPHPHPATRPDIPQIETVAPWQDICFFLSLHMRHQHGLMPLVHKPTFAQDVLQRRDLGDEVFRGLLCSIVAYTICQLPIQVMSPKYARRDLELLLRRCQKTSRAIQLRWHMSPCLESVASLQLDTNTALACTQLELASALLSDIRRQVYSLGLHKAEPREGLNFLEIQICRRLYWEVYQSDKTNVMNSISPISLNDLEGIPPLPLEIDDDYLTTSTSTPQPRGSISYMTGFVAVSRIFHILGQCQIRQKTWTQNPSAGPKRGDLLEWIEESQREMREILEALPGGLGADARGGGGGGGGSGSGGTGEMRGTGAGTGGGAGKGGFERADESSLGIQRANIHITALCVDFALLDFKVHLRPEEDTKVERETLARKAYSTLSSVPIEYLASNGESMRGKVLRIVLDLLNHTSEPGIFGEDVWDWWNMYSSVQFFQVIPDAENVDSVGVSRRTSPQPQMQPLQGQGQGQGQSQSQQAQQHQQQQR